MFTGIIEEVGRIEQVLGISGGKTIQFLAKTITRDLKIGDSISVNGVCLTVTKFDSIHFSVDVVGETILKTTINRLKADDFVNLERALRLSDRLGGHLVQGHVNGIGDIIDVKKLGENFSLEISVPNELEKYLIKEGSIAIDGISLTIAQTIGNRFSVSIIPHTWQNTNLHYRQVGGKVNLEIDVIAKYVEKFLTNKKNELPDLSEDRLKKMGY